MTGGVTWEALVWIIGIIVAAGGVVAAFLILVWRLISTLRDEMGKSEQDLRTEFTSELNKRDSILEDRASTSQLETERAKMVEAELRKDLDAYKVHAAETYATKQGVTLAVERVENAVGQLSDKVEKSVDRLSERIDRLLEQRSARQPTRSDTRS